MLAAARDLDAVGKDNDLQHLRDAYIHFFIAPLCRTSGYVPGTLDVYLAPH